MSRFYQIWLIALVIKSALAIWLPFSNDEAYYWVWGHHPQLSYFDHPPAVGWLMWLGTFFESFGNAARLPGVWLGHVTLLIWNQILKPYLDEKRAVWWLIFVLLSPFLGLGSLIITPDVPLLFFWSLSLLLLLRLIESPSVLRYAALGASLGLGFCSKYMIVLFVPTALLWIFWSGQWRHVRWAYVPITILVGLVFCFPVLYWNMQNDWVSFRFQLDHGFKSREWNALIPLEYVGGQLLLLFPTVVWLATRRQEPKEAKFLHFFGWVPLAFFLYSSFKAPVEANWPIMAHPALLALAFINAPDSKSIRATMGVWLAAGLIVVTEAAHHWLPIDPKRLKTSEFTRFDVFLTQMEKDAPVYLGSYQAAAAVSYKLRKQYYKLGGMNRRDFYDFLPSSYPEDGKTFWIGCEYSQGLPEWMTKGMDFELHEVRLTDEFRMIEVKPRAESINR